jgi:hypothetical protein
VAARATRPEVAEYTKPAIVDEVVRKWDDAQPYHRDFVRNYQRRERSYKGILRAAADAAKWRHKLSPPYAHNLIETVVANTVDMGLAFDVKPSPHANLPLDEATKLLQECEAVGDLLRHEHRVDGMDFKQRPLYLCNAIGGRGVIKTGWNYVEGSVRRQQASTRDIKDEEGNTVLTVPTIQDIEEHGVLRDHSTAEVIHPEDFVVHPLATHLDPFQAGGAQHVFNRCWYSFEQLKMMEVSGYVKNVDALKETQDFARAEYREREKEIWTGEEQDPIEVLEYWCFKNGQVYRTLVGNRTILLRDEEESPFWHGGYPFVVVSSMPQPFTTIGTSEVELIEELQNILWELTNQTMDNVELINNWITLIRSDIDDPDAFEFYPGARWPIDGDPNSAVSTLQPPYQLTNVAQQQIAMVKGDLQNVTSAAPFASGAESATVDQKTATGASIVMNAAQQRMMFKKYMAQQGLRQEANLRIKNCQQFIDDTRLVHTIGQDGMHRFREVDPLGIQGDFVAELQPYGESELRQEKRAEAMQWLQVLGQIAPLAAASGKPVNIEELVGWAAKKWEIDDWQRFFSQDPAAAGAMGAAGPGSPGTSAQGQQGGGPPTPPGQANLGVTSGQAVDASSPSAAGGMSFSPVQAMSRALSLSGGVSNA